MDSFDTQFQAMTDSIRSNKGYGRKAKALLMPNRQAELETHQKAVQEGRSCSCRVCYWARSR
jgi:hypothetical protein